MEQKKYIIIFELIYILLLFFQAKDPTIVNQGRKIAEETEKQQQRAKAYIPDDQEESYKQPGSNSFSNSNSEAEYLQYLRSQPLYDFSADKICVKGANIISPPPKLTEENGSIINWNELRELLTQANGLVLDSSDLQIQYKSEFQGNSARIAMQFESKKGAVSNVSLLVGNANGMLFNISPVKYAEHPQIMIQVLSVDPVQNLPICTLFYNLEGIVAQQKLEFGLPIYSHKFITPVEMPKDVFDRFFDEYTNSNSPNYYKLDYFIKNPAPPQVFYYKI